MTAKRNGIRPTQDYFELRRSGIQGTGAFALRRIRPGTRIVEYTGERISNAEADRRYVDDEMSRHHTFLFTLDDDSVIDAAHGGNEARYINHSCAPNCVAVTDRGRIFIEALTNIQPGVELLYDYAYERGEDADEATEQLYVCHCGAARCRGTILKPARRKRKAKRRARPRSR